MAIRGIRTMRTVATAHGPRIREQCQYTAVYAARHRRARRNGENDPGMAGDGGAIDRGVSSAPSG